MQIFVLEKTHENQFYEVDGEAFGEDFIDFGVQTGPHGAFTWHANYPLQKSP